MEVVYTLRTDGWRGGSCAGGGVRGAGSGRLTLVASAFRRKEKRDFVCLAGRGCAGGEMRGAGAPGTSRCVRNLCAAAVDRCAEPERSAAGHTTVRCHGDKSPRL